MRNEANFGQRASKSRVHLGTVRPSFAMHKLLAGDVNLPHVRASVDELLKLGTQVLRASIGYCLLPQ